MTFQPRLSAQPAPDPIRSAASELPPPPSLESIARDRLLGVVAGLAVLHLLASALLVPRLRLSLGGILPLDPTPLWPALSAPLVSFVSGIFLLVLRLLLPRLPLRWADPLGALVSSLVVANCLCWFAVSNAPERAVPLALVMVCTGFFLFSTAWLTLVAAGAGGCWLLAAWLAGFPPQIYFFSAMLGVAILLAFLVQRMQHAALRQILSGQPAADLPVPLPAFPGTLSPQEVEERFQRLVRGHLRRNRPPRSRGHHRSQSHARPPAGLRAG